METTEVNNICKILITVVGALCALLTVAVAVNEYAEDGYKKVTINNTECIAFLDEGYVTCPIEVSVRK